MISLSVSTQVIPAVRKNLDEIDPNGSIMYYPAGSENKDNNSLDDIITRNFPEAINAVHLMAPVTVLVGRPMEAYTKVLPPDYWFLVDSDGVFTFKANPTGTRHILRVVSFQAMSCNVVITDVLDEASPEGRKQLNRHIRGRVDRPRLVRSQADKNLFRYYSLWSQQISSYNDDPLREPSSFISQFNYLPEALYDTSSSSANTQFSIDSSRIERNVIDYLTAMVLETYSQAEKANVFYERAKVFY